MITKEQAMNHLYHGRTIYYAAQLNSDRTIMRWRVNGMIKTWKTRPDEFSVPIKHGLRVFDYLRNYNCEYFFLSEEDAIIEWKKLYPDSKITPRMY